MKELKRCAVVRFQVEGFHRWPTASLWRKYLAQEHRHQFHFEASLEIFHNEREVEFHDFLQFCQSRFPDRVMQFGDKSCETIASELLTAITRQYENRRVRVSVFEDGEVGAVLEF